MKMLVTAIAVAATLAAVATSSRAADTKASAESSQCQKAKRKVVQEEKWEAKREATIDRARAARKNCSTDPACARYDARVKAMETRKAHHDTRLSRFKADAAKACGKS